METKRTFGFAGLGVVLAIAIVGAMLLIARGVRLRAERTGAKGPTAAATPQLAASPVVTRGALPPGNVVGVLLPPQTVNLAPRQPGKVLEVVAQVGAPVRAGDVLVRLDDTSVRHELAMAKASVRAAQAATSGAGAELSSARERSVRRNATVDVGGKKLAIVSGEELSLARRDEQSAASRAASASANAAVAQAKTAQLEAELEALTLRAPFDGVVAARYVDPGAFAAPGEPLVRILGSGNLRVRFAVPEDDGQAIAIGQRVETTLDEPSGGRKVSASIDRISPEVEPASRTLFVEAHVEGETCAAGCAALAGRAVRVVYPSLLSRL